MDENDRKRLAVQLAEIVGKDSVMIDAASRDIYSQDMTVEPHKPPDVIVMPGTVEEIQEILRFANQTATPVVPFVTGTNLGG